MEALKQTLKKFKLFIIGALVIIGLMFAYKIFYLQPKKMSEGEYIRSENQSISQTEMGREIVMTLNRLKTINIDPEFFQEDRFTRLVDFSVEIQEQPVGKENPFEEINLFDLSSNNPMDDTMNGSIENNNVGSQIQNPAGPPVESDTVGTVGSEI